MMNELFERYYRTRDLLVQQKTQKSDVPLIGEILYYDLNGEQLVSADIDSDEFYDFNRYIPIGTVIDVNKQKTCFKVVAPYISVVEVTRKQLNDKTILNIAKDEVKKLTQNVLSKLPNGQIKFVIPSVYDLEIIEKYPCETLNGLEVLGQTMQNGSLDKHLLNGIIPFISEGNKSIKLLMGGIAPNYYADYVLHEYMEQMEKEKSSYSVMSIEDFIKRSENPYIGVVKADESNCSDKSLT